MMDDSKTQRVVAQEGSTGILWWPGVCILSFTCCTLILLQTAVFSFTSRPSVDAIYVVWAFQAAIFVWLLVFSRMNQSQRVRILAAILSIETCAYLAVRVDGYTGDGRFIFSSRWSPSPDERFEVARRGRPSFTPTEGQEVDLNTTTLLDVPAFRGSDRSGIVRGIRLARNWERVPPRQLWRQPIGGGWSSFAVVGDHCVTQEQRGEYETVVCYELKTGRECWAHRDLASFYEVTGGGGPRATPTIHYGRVYSLGATGILNCLDGSTGRRIWSVNILEENRVENRLFGMAGSPLLIDGMVIVSPGAKGNSLVAYDQQNGRKLWGGGDAPAAYSAPQSCQLAGRRQILNFNAEGLFAHALDDGRVLWSTTWISNPEERNNVCQPVVLSAMANTEADRVFISSGYGNGCAVFEVTESHHRFVVHEQWRNRNLKAKFTSVVIRDGYVYGLDGRILTCLDLQTGERCWKGGRYGHGQLIRVEDLLLIQAESGEVVLVEASPVSFQEIARFQALDDRTWNHPLLAGSLLVIRNDREAACYKLPVSKQ